MITVFFLDIQMNLFKKTNTFSLFIYSSTRKINCFPTKTNLPGKTVYVTIDFKIKLQFP